MMVKEAISHEKVRDEMDKYIASFAGLFPAGDPKYVLVVCYETKRTDGTPYLHLGGGRPAMAFAEIASRTLQNTKL